MRLPRGRAWTIGAIVTALCVATAGVVIGIVATGGGGGPATPRIVVGSTSAPDTSLVADLYAHALRDAGYDVSIRLVDNHEQLMWALEQGTVDVAPDYLDDLRAGLADQPGAAVQTAPATTSTAASVQGLFTALTQRGLIAYPTAPAGRSPAFAVTEATAAKLHLTNLSGLAAPDVAGALTLGAPGGGSAVSALRDTYGANFARAKALDDGGPGTIRSLLDGDTQVALVYRWDPAVPANKLVMLADDRRALPTNNLLPVVRLPIASLQLEGLLSRVDQVVTNDNVIALRRTVAAAPDRRDQAVDDYLARTRARTG
ncbi:glycine betaine ABC transporter substrate-binding protein [Pseudofrankia asymbiotica]|uniref:ABC-type glycine betaine transport system substrate-binding domain-containing protein n=1 Tax=Pseudofrankia asymbiotica TaxID=1834516 RepID=A0A1V2I905_9ACTN|nr:glycine betaine ABC transporter substrate-binding protein [Pseudofrankia asymbiotica]ONH28971.1 hypothetical protein BL253_17975 [Pseudofrankia asymbiotica]